MKAEGAMGAVPVGVKASLGERAATPLVAVAASASGGKYQDPSPGGTACDLDAGSQANEAKLRLCQGMLWWGGRVLGFTHPHW